MDRWLLWVIAVLPMMIDVALDMLGLHSSSILTRIFSGGFFGIIAASVLSPLIIDSLMLLHFPKPSHEELPYESKTR